MRHITELGEAKLQPSEQDAIREAADTLLFSEDPFSDETGDAIHAVEDLVENLVEADRFTPGRAQRLLDDLGLRAARARRVGCRGVLPLLFGLIDYAGLFPPARLPMDDAVAQYRRAAGGPHAWLLERFICPASRLGELPLDDLRLSVVVDDPAAPLDRGGIELVEGRLDPAELAALAPAGARAFAEVAPGDEAALDAVAAAGTGAKVRCGGETPDAVPATADLAAFVAGCEQRGLAWKATAGLHHPFRAEGRHGFVNLVAAAGLAGAADLVAVLDDTDPASFELDAGELRWRGHSAGAERGNLVGYGSCSFDEPVEDLQALGWVT